VVALGDWIAVSSRFGSSVQHKGQKTCQQDSAWAHVTGPVDLGRKTHGQVGAYSGEVNYGAIRT
jgi:hypothetical protein